MAAVAAVLAALVGAGLLGGWVWSQRVLWLSRRRTTTVRLKTGGHFHGVLWQHDARHLVLKNATALGVQDQGSVPMEGEIVLLRENVDYLQVT